jgi:hypothetical protein
VYQHTLSRTQPDFWEFAVRRTIAWTATLLIFAASAIAQQPGAVSPPPLVVLLVVDQMRADYVDRFSDQFVGGFARLLRDGAQFTEVHHAHAITATAAGHATLVTGVHPARHGIPANAFWDRGSGMLRYAAADDDAVIVGVPGDSGRSPLQLRREGITEWLHTASPRSKVFAVSGKDRAAILMGGLDPDGAYWYNRTSAKFVTSSYYADSLPAWVRTWNGTLPERRYLDLGWWRLLDSTAYAVAREDSFPPENRGRDFLFPHALGTGDSLPIESWPPDSLAAARDRLYGSPFSDAMVLEFARALFRQEALGLDDAPDLLLISLSASDLVGHEFGPLSQETADTYFRLDRLLGTFFEDLDVTVGEGNWTVVLTSDHGAPLIAEEYLRQGIDAGRISLRGLQEVLVPLLQQGIFDFAITSVPRVIVAPPFGLMIPFPPETVSDEQMADLLDFVATGLRDVPWIVDAFTREQLADTTATDNLFLPSYRRSYPADRTPDIALLLKERYIISVGLVVDHGTPYDYDTHVPLLLYGRGVPPAIIDGPVFSVDIAPTLAALLGIDPPGDLDGQSIVEW